MWGRDYARTAKERRPYAWTLSLMQRFPDTRVYDIIDSPAGEALKGEDRGP